MVSSASLTNYDLKSGAATTSGGGGGGGGFGGGGGGLGGVSGGSFKQQASSAIVSNSSMTFPYPPLASATFATNRASFNSNKSGSVYFKNQFLIFYSIMIFICIF